MMMECRKVVRFSRVDERVLALRAGPVVRAAVQEELSKLVGTHQVLRRLRGAFQDREDADCFGWMWKIASPTD